jgi:hypothetical protein
MPDSCLAHAQELLRKSACENGFDTAVELSYSIANNATVTRLP